MEGFVSLLPGFPLKADSAGQLRDRIADGLAAFDHRGTYADLLLTRKFADTRERAFPGDAALGQLEAAMARRIQFVDAARRTLRSLAASGEWDVLLDAYPPFEPYQWSFPDIMALRQTALEESARLHAHRGSPAGRTPVASPMPCAKLTLAARRDPDNREIVKLLESDPRGRLAGRCAAPPSRAFWPPDHPEDLRFKRSLHDAERALQDKDFAKAESAIQGARAENKESPKILVLQAKLLAGPRPRCAKPCPCWTPTIAQVADPAARDTGNAARNDILYDLDKKRAVFKQQLQRSSRTANTPKLRAAAGQALALDPDDDDFLYYGGAVAAVFRDQTAARERLDRYLMRSNSLRGDLEARDRASAVRALLDAPAPAPYFRVRPTGSPAGPWRTVSIYCPVSGAFQLPIDSIAGYKLKMSFQWDGNRLNRHRHGLRRRKGLAKLSRAGRAGRTARQFLFFLRTPIRRCRWRPPVSPKALPAWAELRVAHDAPIRRTWWTTTAGRASSTGRRAFNPAVLAVLEGRCATVAGNSFFNPFIWDGLHYFSLT